MEKSIPNFIYNYMTIEKFANLLRTRKWVFSDYMNSNDFRERGLVYHGEFEDEIKKIRFSCFSESWNSPVMWHFYGGNYTGVCIEFDVDKLLNKYDGVEIEKVEYYEKSDSKSWISKIHSVKDYLMIKTKEWEYEKEVRLFYTGNEDFLFDILSCSSKIYAGHYCILNLLGDERLSFMIENGNIEEAHCWPDGSIA